MRARLLLTFVLFLCASTQIAAQEARSYSEGPVSVVTSVKIKDGQFNNYMDYLSKTYKPLMEAQKKAGNVVGYAVYGTRAGTPADPDMYLVVTYANMAAFDGLADRTEAVVKEVTGQSRAEASAASIERSKMRDILGSEMIRELELK